MKNMLWYNPFKRRTGATYNNHKTAPETVSVQDEHLQTVISSADGAKIPITLFDFRGIPNPFRTRAKHRRAWICAQ